MMRRLSALVVLVVLLLPPPSRATVLTVAESGGDYTSIQAALDAAVAGDTIEVHEKSSAYFEKLTFPRSGNSSDGHIVLEAAAGERPVIDGTGVPGSNMVLIDSRSYVKLIGFEIRNNLGVNDGSGVRILGSGSNIEIRDNRIHDIRGSHAMGITVYGTEPTPISDLVIDGNEIYDCEPAQSEALTLNGNVTDFAVTNNLVRDVNNIGIDFIGGEADIQPDPAKVARNGVCRGNRVFRANASYGGGYAAGIYVDGGRDITVENNLVSESDLGIEVGAENPGLVASGIIVRNNLIYRNDKVGIVFGGYRASVGRVRQSFFLNNSLFENDTSGEGLGELWIQYADGNQVRNNIFYSTAQNVLLYSDAGNLNNTLDYNLWYTDAGAEAATFEWNGTLYQGFQAYRAGTGQDANSLFDDPEYADPEVADFHIGSASPAVDAGDPAFVPGAGEVDLDGGQRVNGPRVDMGADEATTCGDGVVELPELCDDGNLEDGDGCDSNCTPTGCGNGIVTAGEDCDDGNLDDGDCCSSGCSFEPPGAPCDDADPCTAMDACDAGTCSGAPEPEPGCREALGASFRLRDRTPDKRDLLRWKWTKGDATSDGDLGDPAGGSTGYDLCVYDEVGGVSMIAMMATIRPGGTCRNRPCWRAGTTGYRYADRDGSAGGVTKIILKPGDQGKARIIVRGKGENLAQPSLPFAQETKVTVQLKNSEGTCWGASYSAPPIKNSAEQFKDTYRGAN